LIDLNNSIRKEDSKLHLCNGFHNHRQIKEKVEQEELDKVSVIDYLAIMIGKK
jgi:hypothetical protein